MLGVINTSFLVSQSLQYCIYSHKNCLFDPINLFIAIQFIIKHTFRFSCEVFTLSEIHRTCLVIWHIISEVLETQKICCNLQLLFYLLYASECFISLNIAVMNRWKTVRKCLNVSHTEMIRHQAPFSFSVVPLELNKLCLLVITKGNLKWKLDK